MQWWRAGARLAAGAGAGAGARAGARRSRARFISSLDVKLNRVAAPTMTQNKLVHFEDILPTLIQNVTKSSKHSDIPDALKWIEKVLQYNLAGGKKNRGLSTVAAYEMLEKRENITTETLRLAAVMGWCVELLQSFLLMLDDIMDGSQFRRGAPCWFRQPQVGLMAINDAILVQGSLFAILKKYFRGTPYYTDVVDTFNEILFQTSMGQFLDCSTAGRDDRVNLSLFTLERYNSIIKYKTAFYTYSLPVRLAMYMTGNRDPEAHRQAENICLKIGHFFQIQDDYLDCFGKTSVIGKDGTDIQEGKCCWPAVTALQLCSPEQRAIMEAHYGSKKPEDVQRIKCLYEELGIQKIYLAQELANYEKICSDIRQLTPDLSQDLFVKLIDKIYKRKM